MRSSHGFFIAGLLCILIACGKHSDNLQRKEVDSLNARAYRFRYVDIDSTARLANDALSLSSYYPDGNSEARLNLAFVAYQRMNFDRVDSILNVVRAESKSPLHLLCADVLEMKTCQRTGAGERFFRAKSQAEDRMETLSGREDRLTDHEVALWVYAQSEFHIITSTYYFYQEQDSVARAELSYVLPSLQLRVDTAQWVYYNYMLGPGGLVEGRDATDITLQEFDYLFRAYSTSRRDNLRYFEANCLQAFATMFLTNDSLLREKRPDEYHLLRFQHSDANGQEPTFLPMAFAKRALSLFQTYDDLFQTACTYRTLGEVCFSQGQYEEALANYAHALSCVNLHHLRYYGDISPDTLSTFDPYEPELGVEKAWIDDERISTVPEWIAGIRQQLSLTYSALGMKQESDYNRNSYLDLLQATNQNQELESRTAELEAQTQALRWRMLLCIILVAVAVLMALLFRRNLKRRSSGQLRELDEKRWPPYRDFVAWNRETLASLEEEKEELDERLQISLSRTIDNKRKNTENRAKVSLVHAILPFLDRIGGEVVRMKQTGVITPERREYIVELVDAIERDNDILTEWIKMEQGQLSLHISTFPLSRLFDIVAEGHYAFDQKGVTLKVESTDYYVKGDESLTLFMINTLADNARKFTPEGGSVTISALAAEEYVEVQVSDTGCGLSPQDVDTLTHSKVYDAATIGSATRDSVAEGGAIVSRDERKGFGYGLMNCRGIIEKYKKTSSLFAACDFGVRSQLGEGSTFFFRLPRVIRMFLLLLAIPLMSHAVGDETAYYDSMYVSNVRMCYADAVYYAGKVLETLNEKHPDLPPLLLLDSVPGREAAEMLWARQNVPVDYVLITGLRNELSLAALALNDWALYDYNNRACIRLHKFEHQDKSLPTYFRRLERTHRNSNYMLVAIILLSAIILFFVYRLLVSNPVAQRRDIDALKQYLQKLFDVARTKPTLASFLEASAEQPRLVQMAERFRMQIADQSVRPIGLAQDELAQREDDLARMDFEQNRLHVQNQILDNCLSTIKHESMFYPSRIRILAEKMQDSDIGQLSELVQYYRHVYTLLCRQADEQVSQPGFKRQHVAAEQTLRRAYENIRRMVNRQPDLGAQIEACDISVVSPSSVIADEILLDMLMESLAAGMMHEGAQLSLSASEDGDFVRFTLRDSVTQLTDEQLSNLFFPEAGHIPFLVAKQILREHDTYCNHPGCRLVAQAAGSGYEIYFTLVKA